MVFENKNKNFDGKKFFHSWPQAKKDFVALFKWLASRKPKKWPKKIDNNFRPLFSPDLSETDIELTFINHATVYIRHSGISFITDPHWGLRASPVSFAGPQRVCEAGAKIEELPALDFVFVSHNHYDHLDLPSLKRLNELYHPQFLIPVGDAALMKKAGITNFIELDWWDEVDIGHGCKAVYVPVKHWSARGLNDRNKSLWGGFVILSPTKRLFFAGDTGYCDIFRTLSDKFGEFSVSLLPIGAYEPRWFMRDSHMNPAEAVKAHIDLKTKFSMAIHFGLWQLTDEAIDQPEKDLQAALRSSNISPEKFFVLKIGQTKILKT